MVAALLFCPAPASAAGWSFHDAVRAAWTRDPTQTALHTAEHSSNTEARAARAWFPAGAIINAQYLDDHFIGSNQGYTTYQGQVSVPFWLPGQGSATERNALADAAVARANLEVERMAVAMRLLETATAASVEQRRLHTLTRAEEAATEALTQSDRMLHAGEESRAEHDAAVAFRDETGQKLAESEERLAGLRADLISLTGVETIPDLEGPDGHDVARVGAARTNLSVERDPRVHYADAVARAADASLDVTKHSWMPQPSAGIQVIRQKQYEALWDTSVGVQVSMQLPSRAQYTPQMMQKVRAQSNAERDLTQARRIVADEYTHTLARLQTALHVLNAAGTQCSALSDREDQLTRAWRVGETPLVEVLRARQAALTSCLDRDSASVAWRGALIRLLISDGATP